MKKFTSIIYVVLFTIVLGTVSSAFAQYDVDIIEPTYEDGSEVFGVDTDEAKNISLYPEGCKSIERIIIDLNEDVNGKVVVKSNGEESPFNDDTLENIYEYCEITFDGITKDDVKSIKIDAKVRKSWLREQNVDENNIGVYVYTDGDEWKYQETNKDKDNSIYVFYTADIEFSENIAVGEYTGQSFLPAGVSPWMVVVCCILLLFLLLLLSILYSLTNRRRNKGGYNA